MNATPLPPSLSDYTPPLPATLVANLASLNIRTAPDLIFSSPAELIGKLPAGSVTFTELTHHIAHVTAAFLIAEQEPRASLEPVSSSAPGGRLIEISGASAAGKQCALALHIALRYLTSHPAAAALWLDTTGDLAPVRLASFVSRSSDQPVPLCVSFPWLMCCYRYSLLGDLTTAPHTAEYCNGV
ncbi:hypothetical protein EI94DRAFT_1716540 [Lactarius quietus]|nr:hypothetical protein EI94DRAFT_1716540 [Lactarius quietus]